MKRVKLHTKVEEPADVRVLIPYTKATEKLQCVIDCLRIQFIQPELHRVDAGDGYWRMLRDAWADGGEFFVVEQDVMVWPGSIAALAGCPDAWCSLPTLCHGRIITTTLGCMKFGAQMVEQNPDIWDRIESTWMYLDAHLAKEMGWPFILPHAHYPLAAHLNESQWPNTISKRFIERRAGWNSAEIGGDPVAFAGNEHTDSWELVLKGDE